MNRYFYKIVQGLSLFLIIISCAHANGWYNDFKIAQLQYSRGAEGVHIVFSGGSGNPNPDSCDHSTTFIAPYTSSTPERERAMLTGIETAYAAGKTVSVLLSGCTAGIGGLTYPSIWYFYTK